MKRFIILLLLFIIKTNFLLCGGIFAPLDRSEWTMDYVIRIQPQDLVALTAVYNERYHEMGANIEKLVLVDYYNPTHYKVITDSTFRPWYGKISHDKSKIVFCNMLPWTDYSGQFFIYYVKDNTIKALCGSGVIPFWNHDDTGFYFTSSFSTSGYFFDITIESGSNIVNNKSRGATVTPEALIDENTLMVFSSDSLVTGQLPGFYLMDTQGNYLSRVNNPHLLGRSKSGMFIRTRCIDWNEKLGLLVYAEPFQGVYIGSKISVTNLDGSYYRNYTSGENYDSSPVWGPEENTILFHRAPFIISTPEYTSYRIMTLNVETGKVQEFVNPSVIDGAAGIRYPDY